MKAQCEPRQANINVGLTRKLIRTLIAYANSRGGVLVGVVRSNGLFKDGYRFVEIQSMAPRSDCAGGVCLRGRRLDSNHKNLSTYSIEWFVHFDVLPYEKAKQHIK